MTIDRYIEINKHRLVAFSLRTCHGNTTLAEDVLATAIGKMWRSQATFEGTTDQAFIKWAFRIVTNTRIEYWRKAQRRNECQILPDDILAEDCIIDLSYDPQLTAHVARLEQIDEIRSVIRTLPWRHREILDAYFFEDCSEAEMAAKLAIPAGTVKSRVHRAVTMFRKRFETQQNCGCSAA